MGSLYFLELQSTDPVDNAKQVSSESGDQVIEDGGFVAGASIELSEMAEYNAKVGKFSLTLDPSYTIGVEVDGTYGGVSSSQLIVGRSSQENTSLVSLALNDYVKVAAYPSSEQGSRDQFITSDTALQAGFADESKARIDGVEVHKFTLNGVGETVKYYFEHEGITYLIEAWDVSAGDTEVMFDDVIRGFRFN